MCCRKKYSAVGAMFGSTEKTDKQVGTEVDIVNAGCQVEDAMEARSCQTEEDVEDRSCQVDVAELCTTVIVMPDEKSSDGSGTVTEGACAKRCDQETNQVTTDNVVTSVVQRIEETETVTQDSKVVSCRHCDNETTTTTKDDIQEAVEKALETKQQQLNINLNIGAGGNAINPESWTRTGNTRTSMTTTNRMLTMSASDAQRMPRNKRANQPITSSLRLHSLRDQLFYDGHISHVTPTTSPNATITSAGLDDIVAQKKDEDSSSRTIHVGPVRDSKASDASIHRRVKITRHTSKKEARSSKKYLVQNGTDTTSTKSTSSESLQYGTDDITRALVT